MKTKLLLVYLLLSLLGFSQQDSLKSDKFNPEEFGIAVKDSSVLVQIVGIGKYDNNILDTVSKKIKDYFGFTTLVVTKKVDLEKYFINNNTLINVDNFLSENKNDTITIYVTNYILYGGTFYVNGATNSNNQSLILDGRYYGIKQTVIHELGHMFGLFHCDNHFCIMSDVSYNPDSDLFCNKCLNKLYR